MRIATIVLFLVITAAAWGAPIDEGMWMQTSSTAGDCAECGLTVEAPTPHLRAVHANNGWVAFIRYHPDEDLYTGFLELTGENEMMVENWRDEVFAVEAVVDGPTLTIEADSGMHEFRATYRRR